MVSALHCQCSYAVSITATRSKMEKKIKELWKRLYEIEEDSNIQIYYDSNGWGYVVDGVFQSCGSIKHLEDTIDHY